MVKFFIIGGFILMLFGVVFSHDALPVLGILVVSFAILFIVKSWFN